MPSVELHKVQMPNTGRPIHPQKAARPLGFSIFLSSKPQACYLSSYLLTTNTQNFNTDFAPCQLQDQIRHSAKKLEADSQAGVDVKTPGVWAWQTDPSACCAAPSSLLLPSPLADPAAFCWSTCRTRVDRGYFFLCPSHTATVTHSLNERWPQAPSLLGQTTRFKNKRYM